MHNRFCSLIDCNNQFQEPPMSSKTKILVLKSRNLIWTAVILVIVILLAILLASALHLDRRQSQSAPVKNTVSASAGTAASSYIPGSYAATVALGSNTVNIVVCVDKNHINSISAQNLAQSVATMYPMVPSVLNSLEAQILSAQSLQGITYSDSTQYTAVLLLEAISRCLSLAAVSG